MNAYLSHARAPFSADLFRQPPADCRGAPFWSWNGRLDRERLFRQLAVFKRMGLGGAHFHVRTGLSRPAYLSDDYLALVRDCADEAERLGLLAWLYDEDRWPSGFAGGLVTADPAFRSRHLRLTRTPCAPGESRPSPVHHSSLLTVGERTFAAAWALRRDGAGRISAARRLAEHERPGAGEEGWWAYVEISPTSSWFNHQAYVDTLNPAAIQRFIAVTHERYAAALGDRLGRSVPAIFTDEPLFHPGRRPESATDPADLALAWTDDLPATYRAAWGEDLWDALPGVVFDRADGGSARDRWRFHDHRTERFASAYADQLGAWCAAHGIASTGHMMYEQLLSSQTEWIGEAMRSYRGFQLPGIDLLCDQMEFTTAKQAQSAARQYGRPGVLSELYGVTNWDFDFQGHKRQGDWQAALGITLRVHHLAWYSMEGEAKRDYPAAIGWQSPWFETYPVVEDHFARLNTVLARGAPLCRVAVVHPIESFWIVDGPRADHADEQASQEAAFADLIRWLLHGLIDFDYLCESTLPAQCAVQRAPRLAVGAMAYDAVVVPRLRTIRASTLDRLEAFADAGGAVLFAGPVPALVDGVPDARAQRLAARCRQVGFDRAELLAALAPWRELDAQGSGGRRPEGLVHQLRAEADGSRWLFVCNTDRARGVGEITLRLRGAWQAEAWDTANGEHEAVPAAQQDGWTETRCEMPAAGHALLRLLPPAAASAPAAPRPAVHWSERERLADQIEYSLSEPNVLLLDRGAWRLDGGAWQAECELLRAGNLALAAAGLPVLRGEVPQPWACPPAAARHRVEVAFTIRCEVAVRSPRLALERAAQAALTLDGAAIPCRAEGFWVDEDIPTVALPDLAPGEHRLVVALPLDAWNALEWCYLLGDFGVAVAGRHARITAAPRTLAFGDWTRQGLPFYGGNVTYRCRLEGGRGRLRLGVPNFRAPVLGVALDGRTLGHIAFAPYRLDLGEPGPGAHALDLTAYGCRINCFGQVHNTDLNYHWWGPRSFRTQGDQWSDEYVLRPQGILAAPQVEASA